MEAITFKRKMATSDTDRLQYKQVINYVRMCLEQLKKIAVKSCRNAVVFYRHRNESHATLLYH